MVILFPSSAPDPWLRKQLLIRDDLPTVAGVLLFADIPQAASQSAAVSRCIDTKTKEAQGFREALASDPSTIEGCLYNQIKEAVEHTTHLVEGIPKMGDESLIAVSYPSETLHEIITNAVLHRDYSVGDDVHIRVFDNRVEVESLDDSRVNITVDNILDERFARNGSIVRILNKFPNPPNKGCRRGPEHGI